MCSPLISVIIPVYNVKDYLAACLDSVLNQTCQDFEIILINDGSTDGSSEICRAYAQKDQRIMLIEQTNQGVSAARNAGLQKVQGANLTFLDSDDLLLPTALDTMQKSMEKYRADVCICGFFMKNPVRQVETNCFREPSVFEKRELVLQYISTNTISTTLWGKMYRAKLFDGVRFPVGKIHEDAFILPYLLHRANRAVCIPESFFVQNACEGSITRSKFSSKNLDLIECEENTMRFVSTYYPEWNDRVLFFKYNAIASVMVKILTSGVYKQNRCLYQSLYTMLRQEYAKAVPLVTPNTKITAKYMKIIQHPILFRYHYYIRGRWQYLKNRLKSLIRAIRR